MSFILHKMQPNSKNKHNKPKYKHYNRKTQTMDAEIQKKEIIGNTKYKLTTNKE